MGSAGKYEGPAEVLSEVGFGAQVCDVTRAAAQMRMRATAGQESPCEGQGFESTLIRRAALK